MIVWGGRVFDGSSTHVSNTGGRYNPGTNSWTTTSTTGAPTARERHTAVWTGSQMIVWGGTDINGNDLNTGGRYCAPPSLVTTNPATNVTSSSATLNGSVDPNGLTTTVDFQYGPTISYGHTTGSQAKTGNTFQSVSENISGLTPGHIYHFRIVANNSDGTATGSDRTFTTP
jgi:hypothetical protein